MGLARRDFAEFFGTLWLVVDGRGSPGSSAAAGGFASNRSEAQSRGTRSAQAVITRALVMTAVFEAD